MDIATRRRTGDTCGRHRIAGDRAQAVYPTFRLQREVAPSGPLESTGHARYVGRIGALAVALGVGAAIAASPGVARADEGAESSSAGTTSNPAGSSESSRTNSTTASSSTESTAEADAEESSTTGSTASTSGPRVPDMNVGNTGGAHTSGEDEPTTTAPDEDEDDDDSGTDAQPDPASQPPKDGGSTSPAVIKDVARNDDSPASPPQATPAARPAKTSDDAVSTGEAPPPTTTAPSTEEAAVSTPAVTVQPVSDAEAPEPPPAEESSAVTTILAAALAPLVLPGPDTPVQSPLMWAMLAWSRRASDASAEAEADPLALAGAADGGPVAVDDVFGTEEEFFAYGNVTGNDDIPGAATVTLGIRPAHGTVTLDILGEFFYTPDKDFTGADTFTYTLVDQDGLTSTGTVTITVDPVNDPPVGSSKNITMNEDGSYSGTLPVATDVDGDTLTYALPRQPQYGTAVVRADGTFTYTPDGDVNGADGFAYTVSDGIVTRTYYVNVTIDAVQDAPVGNDVTDSVLEDDHTAGYLPVTDADGDTITYGLVTQAAHGTVTIGADGFYTYRPEANFAGTDVFTYSFSDGTVTSTRTVTMTVVQVNDPPQSSHLELEIDEDTTATGKLPSYDFEGDTITYELFDTPRNGTFVFGADGSYTYTPDANYNGVEYLTYRMSDGTVDSQYTIKFTITPVNDAPRATNTSYETHWGQTFNETLQYRASDIDVGESLTFTLTKPGAGTVSMNTDGSFSYTPGVGFSGDDTFSYLVTDTSGATAVGVVTVSVANNAPIGGRDFYEVKNGQPLVVGVGRGLVASGYDPDDTLTVISVGTPGHGTVTWSPDGSFTYTPNEGAVGEDHFTYVLRDLAGLTATGRVDLYVIQENRPPVIPELTATVQQGKFVDVHPLEGATDADGDPLLLSNVGQPGHGFTQAVTGGGITYVADVDFVGTDSFTYEVFDGHHYVTKTITVTVTPATPLQAVDDTFYVPPGSKGAVLDVLANDVNPRKDLLEVEIHGATTRGTIYFDTVTRTFVYTPDADTSSDQFSYKLTDPNDPTNYSYGSVDITVGVPGPEPEARGDRAGTDANVPIVIDVLDNDYVPDGVGATVVVVEQPVGGTVEVLKGGRIGFTPDRDFVGTVTFDYRVVTADGVSQATVTVDVFGPYVPPDAKWYSGSQNHQLIVAVNSGVFAGHPEFDGWKAVVDVKPLHGSLRLSANGSFVYTPNRGFTGQDTFTYVATTGRQADGPFTVNIDVVPSDGAAATAAGSTGGTFPVCASSWFPEAMAPGALWPTCWSSTARRSSDLL